MERDGQWYGHYSGDTQAAMEARTGAVLTLFDDACVAVVAAEREKYVRPPRICTAEVFADALNVLPPCRWTTHRGVEFFYVSERLTGDLVNWYGRLGTTCCCFVESAALADDTVAALVAKAAGGSTCEE